MIRALVSGPDSVLQGTAVTLIRPLPERMRVKVP